MENSFSVIIPAYNRQDTIGRAVRSILNQTYQNWELIVVNDGSTDDTQKEVSRYMRNCPNIRMFVTPTNYGRLSARNFGMKVAQKEWICWLDSDDEYISTYLETYNYYINRYPEYDIFHSGMLVKGYETIDNIKYDNGYRIVQPFNLAETETGMASFDKGKIGSGSFVFRKSLLDDIGFFPETKIPYGSDESFPALWVKQDEQMKEICKQNEQGQWLPLGNPFGDDYAFFWKMTRKHKSKCINAILYIQHVK